MGYSALRGLVSCVLILLIPGSMLAADSNAAMLYTNGAAWINGSHVPRPSSAIFAGDLLQTRSDSVANINQPGSTVTVHSDSLVQFQGSSLDLQHGGLTVSTSRALSATAGDVKVTPVSTVWTEFSLIDVDGTVRIAAKKGNLSITDGKQTVTLAEGQQTSRDESSDTDQDQDGKPRKHRKTPAGATPAAGGGVLNSPLAIGAGAIGAGGVLTWVLTRSDNPASPTMP